MEAIRNVSKFEGRIIVNETSSSRNSRICFFFSQRDPNVFGFVSCQLDYYYFQKYFGEKPAELHAPPSSFHAKLC